MKRVGLQNKSERGKENAIYEQGAKVIYFIPSSNM